MNKLTLFFSIGFNLPLSIKTDNAGTKIIATTTEPNIANVFAHARGPKSFPSLPSRPNTGKKVTIVVITAVKIAGPTSRADLTIISTLSDLLASGFSDRCE